MLFRGVSFVPIALLNPEFFASEEQKEQRQELFILAVVISRFRDQNVIGEGFFLFSQKLDKKCFPTPYRLSWSSFWVLRSLIPKIFLQKWHFCRKISATSITPLTLLFTTISAWYLNVCTQIVLIEQLPCTVMNEMIRKRKINTWWGSFAKELVTVPRSVCQVSKVHQSLHERQTTKMSCYFTDWFSHVGFTYVSRRLRRHSNTKGPYVWVGGYKLGGG